jgi:methylmalonyl-CoA mutase N-terminal domain/subunit
VQEEQSAALAKLKAERDNGRGGCRSGRAENGGQGDDNLMPHILEAVREYATLGEICDTLRGVLANTRPRAPFRGMQICVRSEYWPPSRAWTDTTGA